ncbi:MAG: hypothetical protein HY840_07710 [Bacteroidetes bacterium]|nr:hypothetical protein [Bacteroidota bacterium]
MTKEPQKNTLILDQTIKAVSRDTILNLSKFCYFIDSLYEIKHSRLDTLNLNEKIWRSGLYCFDHTGATDMYRYETFRFLKFENNEQARQSFQKIILLYKEYNPQTYNWNSEEECQLFYRIISKGGTAFILFKNFIIEHFRRCNYNYKIQNPREDKILDYLYKGEKPNHNYFLRVCCGCPEKQSHELY